MQPIKRIPQNMSPKNRISQNINPQNKTSALLSRRRFFRSAGVLLGGFLFRKQIIAAEKSGLVSRERLWSNTKDNFYGRINITPQRQVGPTCVATCLSMITGKKAFIIDRVIDKNNPVVWSRVLKESGKGLAIVFPNKNEAQGVVLIARAERFENFYKELRSYNDLFLVGLYKGSDKRELENEAASGVDPSHLVLVQGNKIYDPNKGDAPGLSLYEGKNWFVKRIFRVIPANHPLAMG